MASRSRRAFLALTGVTVVTGVAGCLGDEEDDEPAFLVTNAIVEGKANSDGVRVRVTIENERSDRQTGLLELTLEYQPDGGEDRRWTKTEEISVARGSSPRYQYVFDGVYDPDNDVRDYTLSAEIRDEDIE